MTSIGESQWTVDDAESSDETGKDRKKKDDKAANNRWAQSPLARTGGLLGALNERKQIADVQLRPPLPLEKIISPAEAADDDDKEEEAKPKSDDAADSAAQQPSIEATPDDAFETLTSSKDAELMDIPHVDSDKPPVPSVTETSPASGDEGVSSGFAAGLETLKAAANLTELTNNPNRLITRVLTQVALEGFLAQRQYERYGNEPLLYQQREQIAQLHDEQRRSNERLPSHLQNEVLQPNKQLEIFDQNGNRIILQSGWKVVRSAGGYSTVVDQHNRVVHNAIHYGEAFQREQRREQLGDDVFAALHGGGSSDSGQQDNGATLPFLPQIGGQAQVPPAASSQYTLPDQQVDINHRLPKPRTSIKSAVLSPWLWTAVAILILVYFVAALA